MTDAPLPLYYMLFAFCPDGGFVLWMTIFGHMVVTEPDLQVWTRDEVAALGAVYGLCVITCQTPPRFRGNELPPCGRTGWLW